MLLPPRAHTLQICAFYPGHPRSSALTHANVHCAQCLLLRRVSSGHGESNVWLDLGPCWEVVKAAGRPPPVRPGSFLSSAARLQLHDGDVSELRLGERPAPPAAAAAATAAATATAAAAAATDTGTDTATDTDTASAAAAAAAAAARRRPSRGHREPVLLPHLPGGLPQTRQHRQLRAHVK